MKNYFSHSRALPWCMALALSAVAAGCGGGGRAPILGTGGTVAVAPTVTVVTPLSDATGVAIFNPVIYATFSEGVGPISGGASMTVTCAAPCTNPTGAVALDSTHKIATYTLASATTLEPLTQYTATVTGAQSLATGLPLANPYVWKFTTLAASVAVASNNPSVGAVGVCNDATVSATFDVPTGLRMDPATVTSGNFLLTGPAPTLTPVTAASVLLDGSTGRVASFKPAAALTTGVTYTATIKGGATGVKDLAIPANAMLADYSWTLTVGSCSVPPVVVVGPVAPTMASAATYGMFGGSAGMTSTGTLTVVNGDIGTTAVSTAVTGFHDAGPGCIYTETPLNVGTVTGKINTAAPPPTVACPTEGTAVTAELARVARLDTLTAYNALVAMPVGATPAANLAGLTLAPGVYAAPSGSFMIQGGDLTLQGDANAVWVFQMASTLSVGGPGVAAPQSVILSGGALAKNVFWQVGSAATINAGGGGTMVGTIIAQEGAAFSTLGNVAVVTLNGRAMSLGASVTLVNTVINVPAP